MNRLKIASIAAAALALAACAQNPPREEQPHHFSKDRDGNRIACYETDVANEYDCVPAYARRQYAYAYDPYYYDPFWPWWGAGYWYSGPRYVFVEPSPGPPPPRTWPHRR